MKKQNKSLFDRLLTFRSTRTSIAAAFASLLVACGGGGGGSIATALPPVQISGAMATGIISIPQVQADAASFSLNAGYANGFVITNPTGAFSTLTDGQLVQVPPSTAQGLTSGFTGVVSHLPNGDVYLRAANIDEAFTQLKFDFNSQQNGATVGLIQPIGTKMSITNGSLLSGLSSSGSTTYSDNKITVTYSRQIPGSSGALLLTGTFNINNFQVVASYDYDTVKYVASNGIGHLVFGVSGDTTADLTLTTSAGAVNTVDVGAYFAKNPDMFYDNPITGGIPNFLDFKLAGLDKSDRAGLIPLGGLVITPQAIVSFTNTPSAIAQAAPLSIIAWLYLDINGTVKMTTDAKLLDFTSGPWQAGYSIIGNTYSEISTRPSPVLQTKFSGAVGADINLGVATAADLIVLGIRPATVKAEVGIHSIFKGETTSPAGFRYYPDPRPLDGAGCAQMSIDAYSSFDALVALSASVTMPSGYVPFTGVTYTTSTSNFRKGLSAKYPLGSPAGFTAGSNCPVKVRRTVTAVVNTAPQSSPYTVTGGACSDNLGNPATCELFNSSSAVVGDVSDHLWAMSLPASGLTSARVSPNRDPLNANYASQKLDGTYSFDTNEINVMKIKPTTYVMTSNLGFDYNNYTLDRITAVVDPVTGSATGTARSISTNAWTLDGGEAKVTIDYLYESIMDWRIDKP